MIIGDKRRYLIALLALSTEEDSTKLIAESIQTLQNNDMPNIKTIAEAKADPKFRDYI